MFQNKKKMAQIDEAYHDLTGFHPPIQTLVDEDSDILSESSELSESAISSDSDVQSPIKRKAIIDPIASQELKKSIEYDSVRPIAVTKKHVLDSSDQEDSASYSHHHPMGVHRERAPTNYFD